MGEPRPLDGVAVIGLACRFPGAPDAERFWSNLVEGVESRQTFTDEELLAEGVPPDVLRNPAYVKAGPVLDDIELFDASFFGFNARDAELTDPQHRLFLELAWEAFENAAYDPEVCKDRIGVYAGARFSTYWVPLLRDRHFALDPEALQAGIGNEKDYLATQVSYKLDLRGPSIGVQTACSTSLVAVCLAYQALLTYQCDMALAGGASIRVPQKAGYLFRPGGIASPDGHCRAFDAQAGGTVFGSGVGVVLLKRLEDAVADRDFIHAVIKGAAVNNDGAAKVGYTAPGIEGQSQVIAAAQAMAGVEPDTITYVEAHGTGTPLGDPLEIAALERVFRTRTAKKGFCAIGSVKTNIGHLDVAAGIAGLVKTVLAVRHGVIPPSLNFTQPNPKIPFADSPFFVATATQPWRTEGAPRRAGVSSFGIGGTNAHVIVEEAPATDPSGAARPWQVLTLSARTEAALGAASRNLARHLRLHPDCDLADTAFTLHVGRRAFRHRRAVVCRDREEAIAALEGVDPQRVVTGAAERRAPPVSFLFPGQGAQHVEMGRGLYLCEPAFRHELDRCAEILRSRLGWDLLAVLYPSEASGDPERRLEETAAAQPALFAVEYALARLWISWGVSPSALAGHSVGEYVAACLSGVFSLEDALALVAARGRLMQAMPRGAMLAVSLGEDALLAIPGELGPEIAIAAVNAPGLCVVSGAEPAVADLARRLDGHGIEHRLLHTSHAFHSSMMEAVLEPFEAEVRRVRLSPPRVPLVSNVTGTWMTADQATDPAYWASHLRRPVRFADNIGELLASPVQVLLEVGPGKGLATLVRQQPGGAGERTVVSSLPHPKGQPADLESVLTALGRLWAAGVKIDWAAFHAGERLCRVPLPTYPFERRRYWLDDAVAPAAEAVPAPSGDRVGTWFYTPVWKPSAVRHASASPQETGTPWLVFVDQRGVGLRLAGQLREDGHAVDTVRVGGRFAEIGEGTWEIDPGCEEDYKELVSALERRGRAPRRVVHAWGVGDPPPGSTAQDLGFYSLLFLAQALADRQGEVDLRIVTSGAQCVTGEEGLQPEKATVLGPCTVVPLELPHISCQSIDVASPDRQPPERLAARLREELALAPEAPAVAHRGGVRWVRGFEPIQFPDAAADGRPLRERGVYLITGGLGGIGLVLAEDLARTVRARLVLVGRSALPARETWNEWLAAHGAADRVSRRIRRLQALEALGAEVLALSADVGDPGQMAEVVRRARERFGAIHGVIHAAGVAGGGLLRLKTRQAAGAVLAPKVDGTLVLAEALRDADLDFLALFSSTIGLTGGLGQVDYCAANAFLDAFAHAALARGEAPVIAIDWDGWRNLGMTARENAGEPATRPLHPSIAEPIRNGGGQVFTLQLDPDRDWVLAEHRILGVPVLPGTAYAEIARAVGEHWAGGRLIELRDLAFLSPLVSRDGEPLEVRAEVEREDGFLRLRISGRQVAYGDGDGWQEHAIGRITFREPEPGPRHSPSEIARACSAGPIAGAAVEAERNGAMQLGPRWASVRCVDVGLGQALSLLELPEAFTEDLGRFGLHPALLDRATSFAFRYLAGGACLPLSYRRLTVRGPLPRRLYSHARLRTDGAGPGGTIAFDLTIFDEEGNELVDIEDFMLRRLDEDPGALRQTLVAPALPEGAWKGIDPAFGAEALRRILAWAAVPQVIVSPRHPAAAVVEEKSFREERALARAQRPAADGAAHPRPDLHVVYREPRNDTERAVREIWQRLLRIEPVGIDDDFFELGGHSLLAIRLVAEVRSALRIELAAGEIFRAPTVAGLAARVDKERVQVGPQESPALLGPRPRGGDLPLSYAQERQWFLARLEPDSPIYNQPSALRVEGAFSIAALAASLDEIARRHEAFRTTFMAVDRRPVQRIALPQPCPHPLVDLSALPRERRETETERLAAEDARWLFDLARGPLLRVTLLRLGAEEHVILFNTHHIICDHWSAGVVLRDLEALYGAFAAGLPSPLVDPLLQYADFAHWQRERLRGETLTAEIEYWRRRLAAPLPWLTLAAGRPRPARPGTRGASHPFALSTDLTSGVQAFCRAEGATPFMSLLTAFKVVLHRWSGEADLVVGTPVAGRDRAELEQMVGYFINALALRTDLSGDPTYRELVGRVREVTLGAYAHQELPFEKLVEELQPERRPGYHPIFQVVFNFQNAPAEPARLPGLAVRPLPVSRRASKYDLTLYMWHEPDRLAGAIEYKTDLFDPLEIVRLGEDLETVLACGIDAPGERLSELVHRLSTREAQESRQRQVEVHDSNLRRLRSIRRRPVSVAPLASNGAEEHEAERA